MPSKLNHSCRYPNCPAIVLAGQTYCQDHKQYSNQWNPNRPNANARGYSYKWQQYTKKFLVQQEHIICEICHQYPSVLVDHITPVQSADDPLFWEPSNHQGLCSDCHRIKTQYDIKQGKTRK